METDYTLEELAALEHEQWSHMVNAFLKLSLEEVGKDVSKWTKQANTSYENLSEEDKEKDRIWARKAFNIVKLYGGRE